MADLTGFAIRVSFDPEKVTLLEVTSDSADVDNALLAAGGFPLFLTRVIDDGTVEYGGSLLGATEETAPDEGGLLAYFTFKARFSSGAVQVARILRRTLNGEDTIEGGTVCWGSEPGCAGDFDGSGTVDFGDFFLFADAFGQPATGDFVRFDLAAGGVGRL